MLHVTLQANKHQIKSYYITQFSARPPLACIQSVCIKNIIAIPMFPATAVGSVAGQAGHVANQLQGTGGVVPEK